MPRKNDTQRDRESVGGSRLLLLAAALLLMAGLGSCTREEKPYGPEDLTVLNQWLDGHPEGPAGLMVEELQSGRSAVFLQDSVLRADSITMLQGLLPSIHDAGVRELGVFFLESSAQEDIDNFMVAPADKLPGSLIKAADARLGYIEYCDFMKYIRDFNSLVPQEIDRFRIIGLGSSGSLDAAAVQGMLAGETDEETDAGDAITAGPSIPVFIWIREDDRSSLPDSDAVLVTHRKPSDGLIEETLAGRVLRDRSFSYPAKEEPFSSWDHIGDAEGSDIVIVTPFEHRAVTPIDDFITLEDLELARKFFPDTGNDNMPAAQVNAMNRAIARAAGKYAGSID